jgi:hypothetical protein
MSHLNILNCLREQCQIMKQKYENLKLFFFWGCVYKNSKSIIFYLGEKRGGAVNL